MTTKQDGVIVQLTKASSALLEAQTVSATKQVLDVAVAAEVYARRQHLSQECIDYAHDLKVQALAQIGRMLTAMPKRGPEHSTGGGSKGSKREPLPDAPPTLEELGLDKKTSSIAQQLAKLPPEKLEQVRRGTESVAQALNELPKHTHRATGTGENEWYTPAEYIEVARSFLGGIDLDPASSAEAQETVKAKRYFTLEDDGLAKPWSGKVWLNPPYSQPAIAHFIEKLILSKDVTEALLLVNNSTDTAWFHQAGEYASAICFTRGRVLFVSPRGQIPAPTQGQAFFYFGPRVEQFAIAFQQFGLILKPV